MAKTTLLRSQLSIPFGDKRFSEPLGEFVGQKIDKPSCALCEGKRVLSVGRANLQGGVGVYGDCRGREFGGSLIEVLIALIIFSVAALGMAALQVSTVLRVDDTKQRGLAQWKVQELIERIRASQSGGSPDQQITYYRNGVNNSSLSRLSSYGRAGFTCNVEMPTQCANASVDSAGGCSTQDIAKYDVWSIFCDSVLGVNAFSERSSYRPSDGAVTLKGLDVAMLETTQGHEIYVRWVARDAEQNQQFMAQRKRVVDACEKPLEVDLRLGIYCARVQ